MFDCVVSGRESAVNNNIHIDHAVISITSSKNPEPEFPGNPCRKGLLRVVFDDIAPQEWKRDKTLVMFDRQMAKKILSFAEKVKDDIDILLIHCDAGVSRSPAVAAALCDIYGMENRFFSEYSPNVYVYRMMMDAYLDF